ncbi:MAG: MaoC family protein [Deltaproteobacteria bacterium]|nr:MaoC family protein [Deltaproteobacteria bacterium]
MALNREAVGYKTKSMIHEYRWQDAVLYALGIGAKRDELDFLYESRGPLVYPSYAVIPAYLASFAAWDVVGGNPMGIVHHAQKIALHKPFEGSGKLVSVGEVAGIYDLKRMAQAVIAVTTRDHAGELVSQAEFSIIFRFDGNFGGEAPPKRESYKPPKRDPDFVFKEKTSPEQAALYRLSGDYNPLHIDPDIASASGFNQPILHGLCTFGFVCRAVLRGFAGNDPAKLKALSGEFRKPVWPGETLVTHAWQEDGKIVLRTSTEERPEEYVFQNAYALLG